jgi:SAM-dependent methyltransferase
MNRREHWDTIYLGRDPSEVSWYQSEPSLSLSLARRVAPALDAAIIDVGGGASMLVDRLLDAGYSDVTVLDIAEPALALARQRLGARAGMARWIAADLLTAALPPATYDVWHDRAVFHFLTRAEDRRTYADAVRHAVRKGGHAIVSGFATDGPARCSGLEVVRYSPESLQDALGEGFELLDGIREVHRTPSGAEQTFVYCLFRRSMT